MNHLLTLLGSNGPEIFLQIFFLHSLPTHVYVALAIIDISDLKRLGDWADEIMAHTHHLALAAFSDISQDRTSNNHFPGCPDSPVNPILLRDNHPRQPAAQWTSDSRSQPGLVP